MSQAISHTLDQPTTRDRYARLCIVTAADIEFNAVAAVLGQYSQSKIGQLKVCHGRWKNREITLLKSGVGAAGFAAQLTGHLATTSYDVLLIVGLAGGLDPQLKSGDTVIYDLCFSACFPSVTAKTKEQYNSEQNASIKCDVTLSQRLFEKLRAAALPCVRGAGLTIERVVVEAENKLALRVEYGAAAVDMETYDVVDACIHAEVPTAALRVVLDEARDDLPDFNRALSADGSMNVWRLLPLLLAHPIITARFCLNLRRAMQALKRAVSAALDL